MRTYEVEKESLEPQNRVELKTSDDNNGRACRLSSSLSIISDVGLFSYLELVSLVMVQHRERVIS